MSLALTLLLVTGAVFWVALVMAGIAKLFDDLAGEDEDNLTGE